MVTLAITTYNRYELLVESYQKVLNDDRISEIIIMDDCSTPPIYNRVKKLEGGKVRVMRQAQNRGMAVNKRDAIALAKNDWVIIFDSDNIITPHYLDAFYDGLQYMQPYCFYMPSFARPNFDYRTYTGLFFKAKTLQTMDVGGKPIMDEAMFNCLLNTCNMVVHRDSYCKVFQEDPRIKETDTLYMNYLWLKAGHCFMVVEGMEYDHRVHPGSGWLANAGYNMQKAEELKRLIYAL